MPGTGFEVLAGGFGNTVQDAGRTAFRHQGVPVSGWLDAPLAACANALAGNQASAAVLEIRTLGPSLRWHGPALRLALAGQISAVLQRAGDTARKLAAWSSFRLYPGDRLDVGAAGDGCAYLACAGGFDVPLVMGSRATYTRAGLGGLAGRALASGDWLNTGVAAEASVLQAATPWALASGPIRVVLGPQSDHFAPQALAQLVDVAWQASAAQDRMGLRLSGPPLAHRDRSAADIVSDATTPGVIQVPADGQPIVLLADCQTMGGYPKIATVICADLPRLAHMPAGTPCRFAWVSAEAAAQARMDARQQWQRWCADLRPYSEPGWIDSAALNTANLIDGMINAQSKE